MPPEIRMISVGVGVWVMASVLVTGSAELVSKTEVKMISDCSSTFNHKETFYTASSEILCAIRCNKKQAVGYKYMDIVGSCLLMGEGKGIEDHTVSYSTEANVHSEEVANNRPTNASIHVNEYAPGRAVDGDEMDSHMYLSMNDLSNPWWVVDLGQPRRVTLVTILPRGDYQPWATQNIEIRIGDSVRGDGDFSSWKVIARYLGPYTLDQAVIVCNILRGVSGQFVSIQHLGSDGFPLQLTEVKVYIS